MRLTYKWRSLSFLKKDGQIPCKEPPLATTGALEASRHLIPGPKTLELEDQVAFSYEIYAFERSERVQIAPVLGHVILPLFLLAICSNAWRHNLKTLRISSNLMLSSVQFSCSPTSTG